MVTSMTLAMPDPGCWYGIVFLTTQIAMAMDFTIETCTARAATCLAAVLERSGWYAPRGFAIIFASTFRGVSPEFHISQWCAKAPTASPQKSTTRNTTAT